MKTIITIIVALLVAWGIWWFFWGKDDTVVVTPTDDNATVQADQNIDLSEFDSKG